MAAGSAAFVSAFFAGVFVARATPGPGGGTSKPLLFAGTLRQNGQPMTGPQDLAFTFRKGSTTCDVVAKGVMVDESGGFAAPIPLDDQAGTCTSAFFDGSDVTFDVSVQGATFSGDVSPVPYAKYAEQAGTPDCPAGYLRTTAPAEPVIICTKGHDEIVRVGHGNVAFWIDRYEASVWVDPAGTIGAQADVPFGATSIPDYPSSFPQSGQIAKATDLIYAVSRRDVYPSASITWFQANLACMASGKRLPNGSEWLLAAAGTPDPSVPSPGDLGTCLTKASNNTWRRTGVDKADLNCASIAGAQDMIGNLYEWSAEWYAAPPADPMDPIAGCIDDVEWPMGYSNDKPSCVHSAAWFPPIWKENIPAAAIRGGSYSMGLAAGTHYFSIAYSPAAWQNDIGFRCMIPR